MIKLLRTKEELAEKKQLKQYSILGQFRSLWKCNPDADIDCSSMLFILQMIFSDTVYEARYSTVSWIEIYEWHVGCQTGSHLRHFCNAFWSKLGSLSHTNSRWNSSHKQPCPWENYNQTHFLMSWFSNHKKSQKYLCQCYLSTKMLSNKTFVRKNNFWRKSRRHHRHAFILHMEN